MDAVVRVGELRTGYRELLDKRVVHAVPGEYRREGTARVELERTKVSASDHKKRDDGANGHRELSSRCGGLF